MIDYWKLVREFSQGDCVQKYTITTGFISPYVGTVTAVHKGLGVVDVQWPFGNERCFPDDIVRVNPKFIAFLPPAFDQSYRTYDIDKARKEASTSKSPWGKLHPELYLKLAKYWHTGANEVIAYDDLYRTTAGIEDETLRSEVSKFYRFAQNAGELLVAQMHRQGAYWVAQNRQYRATGEDLRTGKPACPKCAARMRKATYKMHEGSKHLVFACPKCLHLVDPTSILNPEGEPHDWFGTGGI